MFSSSSTSMAKCLGGSLDWRRRFLSERQQENDLERAHRVSTVGGARCAGPTATTVQAGEGSLHTRRARSTIRDPHRSAHRFGTVQGTEGPPARAAPSGGRAEAGRRHGKGDAAHRVALCRGGGLEGQLGESPPRDRVKTLHITTEDDRTPHAPAHLPLALAPALWSGQAGGPPFFIQSSISCGCGHRHTAVRGRPAAACDLLRWQEKPQETLRNDYPNYLNINRFKVSSS